MQSKYNYNNLFIKFLIAVFVLIEKKKEDQDEKCPNPKIRRKI
jgi:hypothetical protein